jgi:hypothetical protein
MAISRAIEGPWIDNTSPGTGICYKPVAEAEPPVASGLIKSGQEPARQIGEHNYFHRQATLPIAAGAHQRRCAMDNTPQNSPLTTDRRRFLGAATAMGAIAATAVHGTALGISTANAQAPAGGAARREHLHLDRY